MILLLFTCYPCMRLTSPLPPFVPIETLVLTYVAKTIDGDILKCTVGGGWMTSAQGLILLKSPIHRSICHTHLNLNIGQLTFWGAEEVGSAFRYQLSIVIMSVNYYP